MSLTPTISSMAAQAGVEDVKVTESLIADRSSQCQRTAAMLPKVVRVRRFQRETHDTFTLTLDGDANGPGFRPGQFNMLYVFGVGEVPISMSGDPAKHPSLVHTIRAVGYTTKALATLRRGASVGLRGPFGSAWPIESAEGHDVVVVCGGIGLAPLRPALYHFLKHRDRFGRIALLYGARTPADILYAKELERWRDRFDLQVLVTADRGDPTWHGHIGLVTTLFDEADFDPSSAIGLMCGPEVMMRFTIREFDKLGVTHDRLFVSLERNMQCAIGFCGHCQFGPSFVCMDGPVFRYDQIESIFNVREA